MIKIITTKRYNEMLAQIESLQGSLLNMQELHKGLWNKYKYECGQMEEKMKKMEQNIDTLEKKLRKAEHGKAEAEKKLKKLQDESRGK